MFVNCSGSGSASGVLSAVDNCLAEGARVISMSLGGGGSSTSANNAYNAATAAGALVIAAGKSKDQMIP